VLGHGRISFDWLVLQYVTSRRALRHIRERFPRRILHVVCRPQQGPHDPFERSALFVVEVDERPSTERDHPLGPVRKGPRIERSPDMSFA
jgi:hypothetical protein